MLCIVNHKTVVNGRRCGDGLDGLHYFCMLPTALQVTRDRHDLAFCANQTFRRCLVLLLTAWVPNDWSRRRLALPASWWLLTCLYVMHVVSRCVVRRRYVLWSKPRFDFLLAG